MGYQSIEQKRAYQLAWSNRRRQDFIDSRGGACEKCGSLDSLEVDHVNRADKVYNPREIWNRRAEVRLAELAKCQVLCKDCHLQKTLLEDPRESPNHGTHGMYKKGCRCLECKHGHAELARQYRAAGKKW